MHEKNVMQTYGLACKPYYAYIAMEKEAKCISNATSASCNSRGSCDCCVINLGSDCSGCSTIVLLGILVVVEREIL